MNAYVEQMTAERKELNREWAYLAGSKDSYAVRRLAEIRRELAIIGDDIREVLANENATSEMVTLSTFDLVNLPTAILADLRRSAK